MGEGNMTQLSRRNILVRSAVTAAAVAASVIPAVASTIPEPACELQGLVDRFRVVERECLDAEDAVWECKYTVAKTYPKRPRALMGKRPGSIGGKPYLYP